MMTLERGLPTWKSTYLHLNDQVTRGSSHHDVMSLLAWTVLGCVACQAGTISLTPKDWCCINSSASPSDMSLSVTEHSALSNPGSHSSVALMKCQQPYK